MHESTQIRLIERKGVLRFFQMILDYVLSSAISCIAADRLYVEEIRVASAAPVSNPITLCNPKKGGERSSSTDRLVVRRVASAAPVPSA